MQDFRHEGLSLLVQYAAIRVELHIARQLSGPAGQTLELRPDGVLEVGAGPHGDCVAAGVLLHLPAVIHRGTAGREAYQECEGRVKQYKWVFSDNGAA